MALITAERLHRWKCLFCGSKDKNIVDLRMKDPNTGEMWVPVKIVTCSQCGRTETYSHSALAHVKAMRGQSVSMKESEEYVQKTHDINHRDPKVNPHSTVGPKDYENTY